jgi:hypothetical protein
VFDRIEAGDSLTSIAADLEVRRRFLIDWLELPANVTEYARSRVRAATSLAESAMEIADTVEPKADMIMRAKLKIQVRQWLARHWDKSRYSEAPGPTTVVNLAAVHADVIRRRSAEREQAQLQPQQPAAIEVEAIEAETEETAQQTPLLPGATPSGA